MAELRKDQRGEIRRQHVKVQDVAATVYVWFHLSHQTINGTSQINHDTGA